jgi:acylphosphatase
VRNLPDGRVEVVAEGEEEQVERLIGWCRGGPPLAVVKGLDIRREPPIGDSKTFTIRL